MTIQAIGHVIEARAPSGVRRCDIGLFPGLAARDRHAENVALVCELVMTFHFTTARVIQARLARNTRPARLLAHMIRAGILVRRWYTDYPEPVYMFTRKGRFAAGDRFGDPTLYRVHPTSVNFLNLHHDLAVQRVLLADGVPCRDVTTARWIEKNHLKTPDAIYRSQERNIALEVELTMKTQKRVYTCYFDHLRAIEAGDYECVRYVFDSHWMCGKYTQLFAEPSWPRYVYSQAKRQHVVDPTQPRLSIADMPEVRERFSFEVHPAIESSARKSATPAVQLKPKLDPTETPHAEA